MIQFERAEYEQSRDIDDFGFYMVARKSNFYIDYYDFLNVAKSFSIDDIKYIERSCNIERIKFKDLDRIEGYLIRIVDQIIKLFSADSRNIIFYNRLINEAKVALYFARYLKLSEEGYIRILRALLFYIPERDMDIGQRLGIWYFLGELTDPKMKDYVGIKDEYDFFVSPQSFDYDKFRPIWLKNYREHLLEKIAQNEYMRPHVIEVLKERIKNSNDKKYLEIFMNHFVS
jgi:hypothetical protein